MHKFLTILSRALLLSAAALSTSTYAVTPAEQLAALSAQAATAAQPTRGQHGKDWSCSSCHSATPTVEGKHASTGKVIAPLAPAFNAERFADTAKSEKWFRRNCNDVLGRECTASEKADVLAWLLTLKR